MKVAILGGGAVTRIFYLPAFRAGVAELQLVAVVDPSVKSLEQLEDLPDGVEKIVASFQAYLGGLVPGSIDAVIVALPHHLHEECVVAALHKGLHVFCEKPLGLTTDSILRMQAAAAAASRQLVVCQPRRSFPAATAIRDLLRTGWLGAIRSVRWREGQAYAWPAESLAQVLEEHGGGELYDIGAHAFDLLAWWLGELRVVSYSDDSAGGTAAEFRIGLATATGIPVVVELSRLYPLANTVEIELERGTIVWPLKNPEAFSVTTTIAGEPRTATIATASNGVSMLNAVALQLQDFEKRIRGLPSDGVGAEVALECARIFDQCRERQHRKSRAGEIASGKRAVVTGAGGFIGTRLVEFLDDRGTPVLALARRAQSCVRLARRAVDIRLADIREAAQLDKALSGGGDVIYHCAVASGGAEIVWKTVVDGTVNVLLAAERHGFRRVVVFSSMLALGNPAADGTVDDDSAAKGSELQYANAKREMERRCQEFAKTSRVEVVILRPTCVFGPFGRDFGSAQLDAQCSGEFFLLDSGQGLANLVYVDNLVEAALLAADADCPSGSAMIVNEEEWPITWSEFYLPQMRRAFGDDIAVPDVVMTTLRQLAAVHRRERSFPTVFRQAIRNYPACADWVSRNRLFRGWQRLRSAVRGKPAVGQSAPTTPRPADPAREHRKTLEASVSQAREFPYAEFFQSFFSTQAIYRSDRARHWLGWHPRVDRAAAMTETLAWVARAYPHDDAQMGSLP